jgi:hypothetical protein
MANVLPLKRVRPAVPRASNGSPAEIVIFPGVRYEYHDTPRADVSPEPDPRVWADNRPVSRCYEHVD